MTGNAAVEQLPMLDLDVPEFFATNVGLVERVGGNCLRIYACVKHGNHLKPVYSVIWPIDMLLARSEIMACLVEHLTEDMTAH